MGVNELSAVLWRERELLELLLFKLEEEQLLLTAGKSRWVGHASREIEQVMVRLRDIALSRSVEVTSVGTEWACAEDATLREIIAAAPAGPWQDIFAAHLTALTELTVQIRDIRDVNEQFLRTAVRSVQETLAGVEAASGTYDSSGAAQHAHASSMLFDEKL
ncbi:flagellar export chaperone FlgN [Microterricola viridarii]|uniref:Flagellar biosynthesis protein FlgN n=1 Tax=Microterricola viridarii TaxID=412690 RepID=A0A0X8E3D0_9MICO|nr:flagellar export chaperone FlgN [Microterricola viridarii]AMB58767.1 flagellar biosynthesis protein FlgN [Microterricola viridarii]